MEKEIQKLETNLENRNKENLDDMEQLKEELKNPKEAKLKGSLLRAKVQSYIDFKNLLSSSAI